MSKRAPIWVSPEELNEINAALMQFDGLANNLIAQGLHSEISVAKTRFENGHYRSGVLATVLGLDKNMLPVRLSPEEKEFLVEKTQISERLKGKINAN